MDNEIDNAAAPSTSTTPSDSTDYKEKQVRKH